MAGTGVTFGNYHSYKAWGLKLKEIKIGLPEVKTSYVEVPGMNGSLDLTEATDHQPAVVTCHRSEITAERDWQQNPGRYRKRN